MSTSATQLQNDNQDCDFKLPNCTGPNEALWLCVDCSARICDVCWSQIPGHRDGVTARDGQPHEKTDSRRHDRLREILNPPVTEDELERLHEADVETTWFGIGINRHEQPFLTDGGIYSSLIAQSPARDSTKTPQLVSFIGQTNAGKSTLIKMLIDQAEAQLNLTSRLSYATPVVGSKIHSRLPTSADVHLYADPKTYTSETPLFYADAEGLDAGEATAIGSMSRRRSRKKGIRGGSKRILAWADTYEKRERAYIVSELYPRLLYTFSDVVVFVLRNEKTFEKTGLERLIKWGAASLETSVNQPTLPKLIIAINAATLNVATPHEWHVGYATESLLQSAQSSLYKTTYFRNLAQSWRDNGRIINSIKDLIRCYYSSFDVVRIPVVEGRYTLLDKQIGALGDTITTCCKDSLVFKRQANMLLNSDEFSIFLHSAFDHFTRDLQRPFNFIEVSRRNNPIPQNFGGHILQLAIAVHNQDSEKGGQLIFEALSHFIASSVLLDCVRHRKALKRGLGTRSLFGGSREDDTDYTPKVAVTATDEEGRRAVVIANYNRTRVSSEGRNRAEGQYDFPRPDDPSLELTYWEAAAATAAAPPYFKSFYHKATMRSYLDGAFYNNNPARIAQQERKLLWADVADRHPDIFLSIGTSKDARQLNRDIQDLNDHPRISNRRPAIPFPGWHQLIKAMHGRMDSILDAEMSWRDFVSTGDINTKESGYRYIRINPNIDTKPPDIDATCELHQLQEKTRNALKEERSTIQQVARLLISSSFYFDMITAPGPEGAGFKCTGRILCKLEKYLRPLGDYFQLQQRSKFQPYFEISEDDYHSPRQQLELSTEIINRMKQQEAFDMDNFDISLSSRTSRVHIVLFLVPRGSTSRGPSSYPISGFPRTLASEPSSASTPPHPTGIPTNNKPNKRRTEWRKASSRCSLPATLDSRPSVSRTFSLPEQRRNFLGNESDEEPVELQGRTLRSVSDNNSLLGSRYVEIRSAPLQPLPRASAPIVNTSDRVPRTASGPSKPHYRAMAKPIPSREQLPPQVESNTRPQEHLPKSQPSNESSSASRSVAHGKRPVVDDSSSILSGRSELPAESVRPTKAHSADRRGTLREPASSRQLRDAYTTPTSNSGTQPESSVFRDELRAARRGQASRPTVPEVRVAPNRAVELPASAIRRSSSSVFVRARGPLSELERRLTPQRPRSAFYGYVSDEDVSQLGSMAGEDMSSLGSIID
ncbi:hypothetical protein EG329_009937 [Mollisiaceae sp. DMI_Dod_QoI]|nr:hypothetical protein EG329_009937 [Helotiales sp. DMI_Dod_QoI]